MAHEVHREERSTMNQDNRSLGELFGELSRETSTLVRQEVQLAKTEMTHKAAQTGKDVGYLAAGGMVAYAGLLTLIAFAVLWLGSVIPMWTSALIVGAVVLAIGGMLVMSGINNLKKQPPVPTETIQTLQDDAKWAKEQV